MESEPGPEAARCEYWLAVNEHGLEAARSRRQRSSSAIAASSSALAAAKDASCGAVVAAPAGWSCDGPANQSRELPTSWSMATDAV